MLFYDTICPSPGTKGTKKKNSPKQAFISFPVGRRREISSQQVGEWRREPRTPFLVTFSSSDVSPPTFVYTRTCACMWGQASVAQWAIYCAPADSPRVHGTEKLFVAIKLARLSVSRLEVNHAVNRDKLSPQYFSKFRQGTHAMEFLNLFPWSFTSEFLMPVL